MLFFTSSIFETEYPSFVPGPFQKKAKYNFLCFQRILLINKNSLGSNLPLFVKYHDECKIHEQFWRFCNIIVLSFFVKGTESRDFRPSVFHQTSCGVNDTAEIISAFLWHWVDDLCGVIDPAETTTIENMDISVVLVTLWRWSPWCKWHRFISLWSEN
jgi:hypothetical protein